MNDMNPMNPAPDQQKPDGATEPQPISAEPQVPPVPPGGPAA